jgi:N-methylhydantoinase A
VPPECSCPTPLQDADLDGLGAALAEMAAEGREILARERVGADAVEHRASVDLRYVGQWHELTVPVEWDDGRPLDRTALAEAFHREHDALFGYSSLEMPVELLAVRLSVVGRTDKPRVTEATLPTGEAVAARSRPVWSPADRSLVDTPVFDGRTLGPGATLSAPAVVELANTTIVVLEGFELAVDRFGSFVLWRGTRGRELVRRLVPEAEALVA